MTRWPPAPLSGLPGAVTVWYLIGGLVLIFSGFVMATRYH